MNLDQRKYLILIILSAISLLAFINIGSKSQINSRGIKHYQKALETYNKGEYRKAYQQFAKISVYSKLKPAALYRQITSAEKLGDKKGVIKKGNKFLNLYSDNTLAPKVKYLVAKSFYDLKKFDNAKKEFRGIIKKYPKTEYATASYYYCALIDSAKVENSEESRKKRYFTEKSYQYFKHYLKNAPAGRFAMSCVSELKKLNITLTPSDNLLIGRSYYARGDFNRAESYFNITKIDESWVDVVKNAYELKHYSEVIFVTEEGLKHYSKSVDEKEIYKAIDLYIKVSTSTKDAIQHLMSFSTKSKGYDYLLYRNCKLESPKNQLNCFADLYAQYPHGQFSADALYNVFYDYIKTGNYDSARLLGEKHLSEFSNTESAPAVMFWMGKIAQKKNNFNEAKTYYKNTIANYPDDYYALQAYAKLNKLSGNPKQTELNELPVEFPYKNNNLENMLARLKDYDLVVELSGNDDFVKSWVAYQKGDYSHSVVLARDAMEKLEKKPISTDLRWRLVYPILYFEEIKKYSKNNNPILIMALVREESYFNPKAKSAVGASGLMQLMPLTANEVRANSGLNYSNPDYIFEVKPNLQLGNLYFAQLKRSLNNRDFLAVLAYNGGIGSVKTWKKYIQYEDLDDFLEQIPYPETQNYLKKVFRSYWNYVRIY